jgi:hypothetical protein
VFEATFREGYEWVMPERQEDLDILMQLDGATRGPGWLPIRMKLIKEDEGDLIAPRRESDFPCFGSGALVLRPRALDALRGLVERYGELLPLTCDDTDLWLFNVTKVVDALDEARSKVVRFNTGGMRIRLPVFRASAVQDVVVFKIPQALHGPIFVGRKFVEAVRSADLRGLDFEPVLTSADDG